MKSTIHVDAELLAAWSEGSLPREQATQVEAHLADCSLCQEMLAAFTRSEPPRVPVESAVPDASRVEGRRTVRWQWAIPIAAAATVAAIWVALPENERTAQVNPTPAAPLAAPPAPTVVTPQEQDQAQTQGQDRGRSEERKAVAPRRDALSDSVADNAAKEASPARTEQFETRSAPSPAAAAAPAQGRLEAPSTLARQASAEVVSPDPLVRWRILPPGRLERTADGGKTWTAITLPEQVTAAGVIAPAATTAIVTASDGRQFRTADEGRTWNLVQR